MMITKTEIEVKLEKERQKLNKLMSECEKNKIPLTSDVVLKQSHIVDELLLMYNRRK